MFKTCSRCGKIHDINYICYKNRNYRKNTEADKFRKTYKWQSKAEEIKERDKHLCRVCIANIYNTTDVYNYKKLEVHHIDKLDINFDKRLEDDNLITLCCYHHKLADTGLISKPILILLTDENCNFKEVRELVNVKNTPPVLSDNKL